MKHTLQEQIKTLIWAAKNPRKMATLANMASAGPRYDEEPESNKVYDSVQEAIANLGRLAAIKVALCRSGDGVTGWVEDEGPAESTEAQAFATLATIHENRRRVSGPSRAKFTTRRQQ